VSSATVIFSVAVCAASLGIALNVAFSTMAMARQPEIAGRIFTIFIMAAAMVEALGLLGFVLSLIV